MKKTLKNKGILTVDFPEKVLYNILINTI